MFFSTTDAKGIIRSGNHVFARVSAYSRDELAGNPHNIIRHPDMPRAVFHLLWEEIQQGRPVAAYIKNLAADGRHYWVMAAILPSPDGYLSIRIKPATDYFTLAERIYPDLLATERTVGADNPHRRRDAIAASRERMAELLRDAGYASYTSVMRAALLAEVRRRDETIGSCAHRGLATAPATADRSLRAILSVGGEVSAFAEHLVSQLDDYQALHEMLATKTSFVLDLADDVQFFSLNAQLATPRMGQDGVALGAVAEIMRERSYVSDPVFRALSHDVAGATDLLGELFFPLAAAKLECEMLMVFVRELMEGVVAERPSSADLGALIRCLSDDIGRLVDSLTRLDDSVRALADHATQLKADLKVMRALELNGRIEAARVTHSEALVALFHTIAERVQTARRELDDLTANRGVSFAREAAAARASRGHVATMEAHAAALGAA
jgi:aerotaxis receptor